MIEASDALPWHEGPRAQLAAARAAGRLPHALLLHGPAGLGKRSFALELSRLCLCDCAPAAARPCGTCRSCRLLAAGAHPDLYLVEPPDGKVTLGVEQIRDLARDLALRPHTAKLKVAVLVPAESMTAAAANALLKTLEEPPGSTLLVLVSARPAALPATIRSRCQGLRFRIPPAADAVAWLEGRSPAAVRWPELLEITGGAPLRALALAGSDGAAPAARFAADLAGIIDGTVDPLDAAARWAREDGGLWWGWIERNVAALVRERLLGEMSATRHSKTSAALSNYAGDLKVTTLLAYWDGMLQAQRSLQAQADVRLVLESLLVPWAHRLAR